MSKLIKLTESHYIIVDDSEIKEGDWYIDDTKSIRQSITSDQSYWSKRKQYKKITHSTQPLEVKITDEGIHLPDWSKVKALSPKVVKELIGVVDVEKKVRNEMGIPDYLPTNSMSPPMQGSLEFGIKCYNQALEDNKEKKYTEEDIRKIIEWLNKNYSKVEDELARPYEDKGEDLYDGFFKDAYEEALKRAINSIQPKTEWDVEFIDGKLKLK